MISHSARYRSTLGADLSLHQLYTIIASTVVDYFFLQILANPFSEVAPPFSRLFLAMSSNFPSYGPTLHFPYFSNQIWETTVPKILEFQ